MKKTLAILSFIFLLSSCSFGTFVGNRYHTMYELFPDTKTREVIYAALENNEVKLQKLLDSGADINGKGKQDITPIFIAVYENNIKAFELLLKHGASYYVKISGFQSLAYTCLFTQSNEFLRKLFEYGYDVNTTIYAQRLIYNAILTSKIDKVSLVLQQKPDLNYAKEGHDNPVWYAINHGDYKIVLLLLQNGSKALEKDNEIRKVILNALRKSAAIKNGWNIEDFIEVIQYIRFKYPELDISDIENNAQKALELKSQRVEK